MRLEHLMTSPDGFGITTASPAQRAMWRIIEGRPLAELAQHPDAVALCGGPNAVAALSGVVPEQVNISAAVRCAKTDTELGCAIRASQIVKVDHLKPGEEPVYPLISLTKDHARVALTKLVATLRARPKLRGLMMGKPTADGVVLRHPTGRPMRIVVAPLSEAGGAVQSVWLFGLGIDEYPRQPYDGIVRVQDVITSARGRLLPGAQIDCIGSPWAMGSPAHEEFQNHFGKPTEKLVVLHGTGPMLNPSWWTPERCAKLERNDKRAYLADVLGEFVSVTSSAFDADAIERIFRERVATSHSAPIVIVDPSSGRSDGWTWCVARWAQDADGRFVRITHIGGVLGKFWQQVSGESIIEHVADIARGVGATEVHGDQREALMIQAGFARHNLRYVVHDWGSANKIDAVERVRRWMQQGALICERHDTLKRELFAFEQRITPTGQISFSGRREHDDHAALILTAALALGGREGIDAYREKLGRIDIAGWGGLLAAHQRGWMVPNAPPEKRDDEGKRILSRSERKALDADILRIRMARSPGLELDRLIAEVRARYEK